MSDHLLPITDYNLKDTFVPIEIDFPIQYYVDELEKYPGQEISLHWHTELEFYIVKGCTLKIQLGQETHTLADGEGVFINSNILHSYAPAENGISTHPNIVFSTEVIAPYNSTIYKKYILPIFGNKEIPYIILNRNIIWQKEILDLLDKVFSLFQKYGKASDFYGQFPQLNFDHAHCTSSCYELEIHLLLVQIWKKIYDNRNLFSTKGFKKEKHILQIRMQKMLSFIQNEYSHSISLKDIATSAGIGKSEASRCFDTFLKISPGRYLRHYRIKEAQKLLTQTDLSVTEIADSCGFESSSYFCKIFRLETDFTPLQYRQQNSQNIR